MREPKQMDPKEVVVARFSDGSVGLEGIRPAPTKYHVATVPEVVTWETLVITWVPQKKRSMKNASRAQEAAAEPYLFSFTTTGEDLMKCSATKMVLTSIIATEVTTVPWWRKTTVQEARSSSAAKGMRLRTQ